MLVWNQGQPLRIGKDDSRLPALPSVEVVLTRTCGGTCERAENPLAGVWDLDVDLGTCFKPSQESVQLLPDTNPLLRYETRPGAPLNLSQLGFSGLLPSFK